MLDKFGDEYREYQRRVPMFIPRFEGGYLKEG
jgi:protein-S-isoprenylcysteine O-methyltransferase Ste14